MKQDRRQTKGLSRRGFIRTPAAGVGVGVLAGLVSAKLPAQVRGTDVNWDKEADVVVGGGAAGLPASHIASPVKTRLATLAVFTILCVAPMPAACQQKPAPTAQKANGEVTSAQPIRRLADGHPDLNGFWASSAGPDTPVGGFGPLEPNIRRGDNGARARLADPNQPPYKPELIGKVKELARNESKLDPAFFCKPGGVPRIGPPHAIIQAPGMPIVFLYQVIAGNTFRLVPTDGRPHDPEADPGYYGDSIGYWEGDTLVVDTTNFNDDTWLGLDGWFHSTALHVVERITREGDTIRYQATVEDPNVFTRPWTMNARIAKATTDLIVENAPCVERDEGHIIDYDLKTRPQ